MKPAIQSVRTGRADLDHALAATKQTLDEMTGQARNAQRLEPLPSTASLSDVIVLLNALLARIQ